MRHGKKKERNTNTHTHTQEQKKTVSVSFWARLGFRLHLFGPMDRFLRCPSHVSDDGLPCLRAGGHNAARLARGFRRGRGEKAAVRAGG